MTWYQKSKVRLILFRWLSYALVAATLACIYVALSEIGSSTVPVVKLGWLLVAMGTLFATIILRMNFDRGIKCPQCRGRILRIGWKGERPLFAVGMRKVVFTPRHTCRFCGYDLDQPVGSPVNTAYRHLPSGTRNKPAEHGQDIEGYLSDAELALRVRESSRYRQASFMTGIPLAVAVAGLSFVGLGMIAAILLFSYFVVYDLVDAAVSQADELVVCPDCGARWQKLAVLPADMQLLSQFPMTPRSSCWNCGYHLKTK